MKLPRILSIVLVSSIVLAGIAYSAVQDSEQEPAKQKQEKQAADEAADEAADPARAASDQTLDSQFAPVDNMHHFMEYVCEPSYKSLKQIMTKEPEDRRAWKAFKNHALVLAESSALVSLRGPDEPEQSKQWKQLSLNVYQSGAAMYKASGNFEEAKKHYSLMIDNCNQCHTVFAEGKHQLEK